MLPPGNKKFWLIAKSLKNTKNFPIANLTVDNVEISNNDSKVNAIANVIEQYHKLTINNTSTMDNKVENYINIINNHNIRPKEVFLTHGNELINITNKFKNNKSTDLDMLQAGVLKNSFCLLNSYFPKIVTVSKKGKNPKLPNS